MIDRFDSANWGLIDSSEDSTTTAAIEVRASNERFTTTEKTQAVHLSHPIRYADRPSLTTAAVSLSKRD